MGSGVCSRGVVRRMSCGNPRTLARMGDAAGKRNAPNDSVRHEWGMKSAPSISRGALKAVARRDQSFTTSEA